MVLTGQSSSPGDLYAVHICYHISPAFKFPEAKVSKIGEVVTVRTYCVNCVKEGKYILANPVQCFGVCSILRPEASPFTVGRTFALGTIRGMGSCSLQGFRHEFLDIYPIQRHQEIHFYFTEKNVLKVRTRWKGNRKKCTYTPHEVLRLYISSNARILATTTPSAPITTMTFPSRSPFRVFQPSRAMEALLEAGV
jgi:hypothetical protein